MLSVAVDSPSDVSVASARKRKRQSRLLAYFDSPAVIASAIVLALLLVAGIAPALIAPGDPIKPDLTTISAPPVFMDGGTAEHILGQDQIGRDMLSRLVHGARVTLIVGLLGTLVSYAIGVTLGLVAGYFGGRIEEIIMRLVDLQMAFPFLLLAIVIAAVLGPSLTNVIIVLALTRWTIYARLVRGQVLSAREEVYVESALAAGASRSRILFRHILPNILAPTIVIASFDVGANIIVEASLSFLGLGVQPPAPSWGNMLADGRLYLSTAWWISTVPGVALSLTLLAINIQGDRLRDVLDPTVRT